MQTFTYHIQGGPHQLSQAPFYSNFSSNKFKPNTRTRTTAKSQTMARSKLVGEIGGLIKTQGAALLKMARIGTSREKRAKETIMSTVGTRCFEREKGRREKFMKFQPLPLILSHVTRTCIFPSTKIDVRLNLVCIECNHKVQGVN